jgi:Tol biopolymer transport system component
MDMMPQFNNATKMMTFSQKQNGNTSIMKQRMDGFGYSIVFDPYQVNDPILVDGGITTGNVGCQQPSFTADVVWITFSLGWWLQNRTNTAANVFRVRSNGSDWEQLTGLDDDLSDLNSGYSSYSPDSSKIVYRVMGPSHRGLRIYDIEEKAHTMPLK